MKKEILAVVKKATITLKEKNVNTKIKDKHQIKHALIDIKKFTIEKNHSKQDKEYNK